MSNDVFALNAFPPTEKMWSQLQNFLMSFKESIRKKDAQQILDLFHPGIEFLSPVVHSPYREPMAILKILQGILIVLQDFEYTQVSYARNSDGSLSVVLNFRGKTEDPDSGRLLLVEGADFLVLREHKSQLKIQNFRVMVRPAKALLAVRAKMGQMLAGKL